MTESVLKWYIRKKKKGWVETYYKSSSSWRCHAHLALSFETKEDAYEVFFDIDRKPGFEYLLVKLDVKEEYYKWLKHGRR